MRTITLEKHFATPLFIAERIMFSADYLYAPMDVARKFLDQMPVTDNEREMIAHGNAEKLLKF